MFKKIVLLTTLCVFIGGQTKAQYCTGNPDNSSPFDWTASFWQVYISPNNNSPGQLNYLASPYHPITGNTQPNTSHIEANPGLGDYKPSDGWVLIRQEMGLALMESVVYPQFVLYNRFESKLRYFVFLAGITEANDVEVSVNFDSNQAGVTHVSAALEHAFTPMDVVESYQDKRIVVAVPNMGFFTHGVWIMADIPIAYDPCTCRFSSAMRISTRTSSYSTFVLNLDGGGDITQVIGSPSGGSSSNSVLNAGRRFANVTGGINTGISKGVSAYKTAGELASVAEKLMLASANRRLRPDLISTLNTISGININSVTGISSAQANFLSQASNLLPGQADAVHQLFPKKVPAELVPDWLKTAIPFASTAFALLDFIIGGGKSTPPQPMHFNADFSFKGEGTFTRSQPQTSATFYIPGSLIKENITTDQRRPVYDKTLGILNVVEQPVMYRAQGPVVPSITTPDGATYSVRSGFSLKLTSPLKYALNPASGMQLNDIRAAMYFYNCAVQVNPQTLVPELMAGSGLIEEEPGVWRTPYMPVACLDAYTVSLPPLINFPNVQCDTDIQLHLIAKLTSPAGKETAWAARYRVNTAPAPYTYENTPPNPYLNVQENVEVANIQDLINRNIRSWNPVVVRNDIVVTRGEVENYLNGINAVRNHENVVLRSFVRGQTIKAPATIDLAPNCGSNPPVSRAWLSTFCADSNRYSPILALRTPQEEEEPIAAKKLNLSIAPNPTGEATLLKYNLIEAGPVQIVLSDYTGRQLAQLHIASKQAAGEYQLHIPLERYAPGIYVVTVVRPSGKDSVRVVKH